MMEPKTGANALSPVLMIIVTLAAVFLGMQIVGPLIGFFAMVPFYPGTLIEMGEAVTSPQTHPEIKMVFFVMQGCATFFGLILVPIFLLKRMRRSLGEFFQTRVFLQPLLMVVAIVIVFMVVNSVFISWNENVSLPEFLAPLEKKLKSLEEQFSELTTFLTKFESTGQVVMAFLVIAVLPAIGEELVFRGIIQNELYRGTRNIHTSIWVAAFIFSAIHLQFYGLIPRMLLGAMFGYLYYWSGSLLMSMVAHFVNNGFTVLAMYFYQQGILSIDMENTEPAPWQAVLFSLALTALLLYLFKSFYDKQARPTNDVFPDSSLSK